MEWIESFADGAILLNQNFSYLKGKDSSIIIHYWGGLSGHYNNKRHQHSFFELCYIVNGEGTYIDKKKVVPVKKKARYSFLARMLNTKS